MPDKRAITYTGLLQGALFSAAWAYFLGWLVVPCALLTAALWDAPNWRGGRAFRFIGCPAVLLAGLCLSLPHCPDWFGSRWALLVACTVVGAFLTSGWGIPTDAPGTDQDDPGSFLGRIFWTVSIAVNPGGTARVKLERDATAMTMFAYGAIIALLMTPLSMFGLGWYILGAFLMPVGMVTIADVIEGEIELRK